MKNIIFNFSCAMTAVILVAFFCCVNDMAAYNGFMNARSKIFSAASLSCGIEEKLETLGANEKTIIMKIPSTDPAGMIMPDFFDYCVVTLSDNILMFSLIPSKNTGRKHKTLYYKNFPPCSFSSSGNMLEFNCRIKNRDFQHYSSVIPDFLPVPEKGADIFQ